jgi:hypothetical protein
MLRIKRILTAISQLINCFFFGGRPNEMTSSKIYRLRMRGSKNAKFFSNLLNIVTFEKDHCLNAYLSDKKRAEELLQLYKEEEQSWSDR